MSTPRCCAGTGTTRGGSTPTLWSAAASTRSTSAWKSPGSQLRNRSVLSGRHGTPSRSQSLGVHGDADVCRLRPCRAGRACCADLVHRAGLDAAGAAGHLGGERVALAGSQVKRQLALLQRTRTNPQGAVADGMLVALGTFLVFIPGLVTTALGALMLMPPSRGAMRPLAGMLLTRGIARRVGVVNLTAPGRGSRPQATATTSTVRSSTSRSTAASTMPTSSGATTSRTPLPPPLPARDTDRRDHTAAQRTRAQLVAPGRHCDGRARRGRRLAGQRRRGSSSVSVRPRSSTSTGPSSRRHSSTATST